MLNLKRLLLVTGTSAVVAVISLTGCKSKSSNGSTSQRTEGRQLDDRTISENVAERLKKEPVYKFEDVDVRTYGGVVQLAGFVNTEDQKRRAGDLAATVPGVSHVINNISLKPEHVTPTGKNDPGYNY
jgi:osmotically-inducible protein OsmY